MKSCLYLDEENRIDGVFQTDIKVELSAENRRYFINIELLRKIRNQIANIIEEKTDTEAAKTDVPTADAPKTNDVSRQVEKKEDK